MKRYTKISLILVLPILAVIAGCIKEEQYPVEPHIEFIEFATLTDVTGKIDSLGLLRISYTDGDGDIGFYPDEPVEPLNYNYYLKMFQYVNNQLVEVEPANNEVPFNARIPILTPTGRNKNIKGTIDRSLDLYFARQVLLSDTIKFEIYIKDRALNVSNVVETPLYIIKK